MAASEILKRKPKSAEMRRYKGTAKKRKGGSRAAGESRKQAIAIRLPKPRRSKAPKKAMWEGDYPNLERCRTPPGQRPSAAQAAALHPKGDFPLGRGCASRGTWCSRHPYQRHGNGEAPMMDSIRRTAATGAAVRRWPQPGICATG
jgi:hypothetical protein